jgi:NADH-quinone oxidoreductase subunit L
LIIYAFWELVGVCSYLLISFWNEKETAIRAAKKAFLINRFGDIGFFIGIALLWFQYNTLSLTDIATLVSIDNQFVIFAALGFIVAAAAKSAQLPFSMWLPDAMEAPTPVSALLHAATMVAAGAYLLIRIDFLLNTELHIIVLIIGSLSAIIAAITACYQTEMKKILAFSTISQVGLMFIAVGLDMPELAFFHLITHAFFKANLFLSVGFLAKSTNHQLNKIVLIAYCISAASLAGVPFTSGFLSKELILYSLELQTQAKDLPILNIVFVLFLVTSFCTAYYITRQAILLYYNSKTLNNIKISTQKISFGEWKQISILFLLALLSLFFPFSLSPFEAHFFIKNANITYSFDILIFFIAMLPLGLGSFLSWLFCYYRYTEIAKTSRLLNSLTLSSENLVIKFKIISYLVIFYEKLILQFAISGLRYTSSAAFHQNYFIKIGHFITTFSTTLAKFDSLKVDGIINTFAVSGVMKAHFWAWFDKNVVDGFINFLVWVTGKIANRVRNLQNGHIQVYIGITIIGIIILVLLLVII